MRAVVGFGAMVRTLQSDPYSTKEAVAIARRRLRLQTRLIVAVTAPLAIFPLIGPSHWLVGAIIVVGALGLLTAVSVVHHRTLGASRRIRRVYRMLWAWRVMRNRRAAIRHAPLILGGATVAGIGMTGGAIWGGAALSALLPSLPAFIEMLGPYLFAAAAAFVGISLWIGVRTGWEPRCPRCDAEVSSNPLPLQCPVCRFVLVPKDVQRGRLARRRLAGGLCLVLTLVTIFAVPVFDRTPMARAISRALPTGSLLLYVAGHPYGGMLLRRGAQQEAVARLEAEPDARAIAVEFFAESFERRRDEALPYAIRFWPRDAIRDGLLSEPQIDRLATGALRGTQRGHRVAEEVWKEIAYAHPATAARAREAAE